MPKLKNKDLESLKHERQSDVGYFKRSWPGVKDSVRVAAGKAHPSLDAELGREASCAFGDIFRPKEDKDIHVVGVHAPQLHKREVKRGILHFGDNCLWVVGGPLPGRAKSERARDVIGRLEEAAKKGDVRAFLTTVRTLDWEHEKAERLAHVIDLAFRIGAPTAAEYVYHESEKRHAGSPALQTFARLFAPEEKAARRLPANTTLKANSEWLKSHRAEYRGQWVAVRNGELLATATSLDELMRRVGDTTNVLLTKA